MREATRERRQRKAVATIMDRLDVAYHAVYHARKAQQELAKLAEAGRPAVKTENPAK